MTPPSTRTRRTAAAADPGTGYPDPPSPDPHAATATGLLAWGQAGNYNAIDDRSVIAALMAGGRASGGLVTPPTFTAATGLSFTIGPWLAIVDCGDGTKAVIGSRAAQVIDETAGGGSARTDVVWADISPDAATYTISIISEAAMVGRAGCFLGLIVVPSGANVASAMDLRPGAARVLGVKKAFQPNLTVSATTWRDWARLQIPAYDAEVGAVYQLEAWGGGQQGSPNRSELDITCALNGAIQAQYGRHAFDAIAGVGGLFRQWVRVVAVCLSVGTGGTFQCAVWGEQAATSGPIGINNVNFASVFACDVGANVISADTTRDITLAIQAQFTSGGGANIVSRQAIGGRVA